MDLFDKMKMPIRCPLCNEILLNEYGAGGYLSKNCQIKPDHAFYCSGRPWEDIKISKINILIGSCRELSLHWDMENRILSVCKSYPEVYSYDSRIELPFIELDLLDPYRAINKIKTLLPFA